MGMRIIGMASGLPPNIVEQLMEAERIPVQQMEQKKQKNEEKLKILNDLIEKINNIPKSVENLIGIKGFKNNKFTSGDEKIVSGIIDPEKVTPGEWQIEVIQLAKKSGVQTNSFPDKNKTLAGAGYLKFETNQGTKEIYISRKESTLEGIAQAINRANIGINAQVVENNQSSKEKYSLIITGLKTGKDQNINFPQIYLLDGEEDLFFEQRIQGQNGKIKLDGLEFEFQENNITDLIPGVTLELKQASPNTPIVISVKEDFQVIGDQMKNFVDTYNQALSWIQNQAKLQKDKSGKERLGPFGGDGLIRSVENKLRQIILQPQNIQDSKIQRLSELGIEFNRNGTLNFNEDKFKKILTTQPYDVVNFLRGNSFTTGFIPTVRNNIAALNNPTNGPLGNRTRGIQERIKQIDERIEKKEAQLVKKEESLRRKFTELESKMAKLQSQGMSFSATQLKPMGPNN